MAFQPFIFCQLTSWW